MVTKANIREVSKEEQDKFIEDCVEVLEDRE